MLQTSRNLIVLSKELCKISQRHKQTTTQSH